MGTSRSNTFPPKVWLKICIAGLLLSCTPFATAIRDTVPINTYKSAVEKNLASYNDVIAGKSSGLYEQSHQLTQSGVRLSINDPSKVPQDQFRGQTPIKDSNLIFDSSSQCDYAENLQWTQDLAHYLPDGMPIFHVAFYNTCLDCPFGNIHIECGNFASATLVNPNIFKRVAYNDCLLNNGAPLGHGDMIAFEYSSTFAFPMNVGLASPMC